MTWRQPPRREQARLICCSFTGEFESRLLASHRDQLRDFLINGGTKQLTILLAIHRSGVLVKDFMHFMEEGIPPPGLGALLIVLVAHCTTTSSFLKVLVGQSRVGLYQKHEPQEAE